MACLNLVALASSSLSEQMGRFFMSTAKHQTTGKPFVLYNIQSSFPYFFTKRLSQSQLKSNFLTSELELQLAVDQLVPLQHFAQAGPFVIGPLGAWRLAEGKLVIVVGFLRVVVRSDLVHPQANSLSNGVLHADRGKIHFTLSARQLLRFSQ